MRNSQQRTIILEILQSNMVHPTADFVYEKAKKEIPSISLATVYRNLNQLADNGIIKKIVGIDGQMHFDHNICEHHHFVCNICKSVYDIACDIIPQPNKEKLNAIGLDLTKYDINLSGICHKCNNK